MLESESVPEPPLEQTLALAAGGDESAWRRLVDAYGRRVYGLLLRQCGDRELAEELTQATFVKVATTLGGDRARGAAPRGDGGAGGGPGEASGDGAEEGGGRGGGSARGSGGRYEERGQFEPWLFRIAINALRDEMRRRGRQARTVDMGPMAADEPADPMRAAAHQALARRAADRADDPAELMGRAEQVRSLKRAVAELSEAEQRVLHLRHTAGLSFAQIAEALGEPLGTVLARGHRALGKLRKRLEQLERADERA